MRKMLTFCSDVVNAALMLKILILVFSQKFDIGMRFLCKIGEGEAGWGVGIRVGGGWREGCCEIGIEDLGIIIYLNKKANFKQF